MTASNTTTHMMIMINFWKEKKKQKLNSAKWSTQVINFCMNKCWRNHSCSLKWPTFFVFWLMNKNLIYNEIISIICIITENTMLLAQHHTSNYLSDTPPQPQCHHNFYILIDNNFFQQFRYMFKVTFKFMDIPFFKLNEI